MRLLARFAKKPVIINQALDDRDRVSQYPDRPERDNNEDKAVDAKPSLPPGPPSSFAPTSIPELHPEYAHSEPYCFVARTESARIVVDRLRGARGQPAIDHANILKQQGVTVVRGPTATSPLKPHTQPVDTQEIYASAISPPQDGLSVPSMPSWPASPARQPSQPVVLKIETPTSGSVYVDSDDEISLQDENIDANVQHRSRAFSDADVSKKHPQMVSENDKEELLSQPRRLTPAKPFRIKSKAGRKSKAKLTPKRSSTMPSMAANSPGGHERRLADRQPSDMPSSPRFPSSPPSAEKVERELSFDQLIEQHMDNTPEELLAPIMVPRTSVVFGENFNPSTVSSSQRYADVEGDDNSCGVLPLSTVGNSSVVHKVGSRSVAAAAQVDHTSTSERKEDEASSPSGLQSLRSRRKSKPFLSPTCHASVMAAAASSAAPLPAPAVSPKKGSLREPTSKPVKLSPIPPPTPLSREPSLGMLSDDVADESATDDEAERFGGMYARSKLIPVSKHSATRQRAESHTDLIDVRKAAGVPPALVRRTSSAGKRKTVSFHDAAPVIIEPNLRAPSLSVPRSFSLAKESCGAGYAPSSIGSALSHARDSVKLSSHVAPLVDIEEDEDGEDDDESLEMVDAMDHDFGMDDCNTIEPPSPPAASLMRASPVRGPTLRAGSGRMRQESDEGLCQINPNKDFQDRQRSDMSGTSQESWSRMSRRVSIKDREAIKAATKRQSVAVAQAMLDQIHGRPKSAMLAYSQNEVIVDHDDLDDDDTMDSDGSSSKELWGRRSTRASKSIRMPEIKAGEVPPPPPPPPFSPSPLNRRSVRDPPPPPSSPLLR